MIKMKKIIIFLNIKKDLKCKNNFKKLLHHIHNFLYLQ